MKKSLLTILRDHRTTPAQFRATSDKLFRLMAAEMAECVAEEPLTITTPIKETVGFHVKEEVVLVAILRAGLAMLPAFMELFELSRVGLLGIRRCEKSAKPELYYSSIPTLLPNHKIFLLDPMIATAGSSLIAIEKLISAGADPTHITLVSLLAAPEGLSAIEKAYPDVEIQVLAIDEKLNAQKFIEPGLGDFGDRYFGTIGTARDVKRLI